MCTQQYAIEVLKSVLIPFLGNLDEIVVCCSQRYFLDYCHCSISSSSIGNNNKNTTFIRTTRWCVCIPYDACKCIALRCIHAPFNIFYIFIWCVYQNQRQSHLMEYWILSKVQFVHLCACKRNYFDETVQRTTYEVMHTLNDTYCTLHTAHCIMIHKSKRAFIHSGNMLEISGALSFRCSRGPFNIHACRTHSLFVRNF